MYELTKDDMSDDAEKKNGSDSEEDDYKAVLTKWGLAKFIDAFDENGYDDPQYWHEIEESELTDDMGMKKGHLRKWKAQLEKYEKRKKLKEERKEDELADVQPMEAEPNFNDEEKKADVQIQGGDDDFDVWYSDTNQPKKFKWDRENEVVVNVTTNEPISTGNRFESAPEEDDPNHPITAIDIGYSSCNVKPVGCPSSMIRGITRMNVRTRKEYVENVQITWAPSGADVIPWRTLKLCNGLDEWVTEVRLHSSVYSY